MDQLIGAPSIEVEMVADIKLYCLMTNSSDPIHELDWLNANKMMESLILAFKA